MFVTLEFTNPPLELTPPPVLYSLELTIPHGLDQRAVKV